MTHTTNINTAGKAVMDDNSIGCHFYYGNLGLSLPPSKLICARINGSISHCKINS